MQSQPRQTEEETMYCVVSVEGIALSPGTVQFVIGLARYCALCSPRGQASSLSLGISQCLARQGNC